jgi:hypothetical protein
MRTQKETPQKWKRIVEKRDPALGAKQKYILRWAKKIKAIDYKGGECCRCGEKSIYALVFHHRCPDAKEYQIEGMLKAQKRWSDIELELDKCDLVCENCHREIHFDQKNIEPNKSSKNKQICFEFKECFSCVVCGYSKCIWALEFHHHCENKISGISKICSKNSWKSVGDLQQHVIDELNKCEVYCSNCHKKEHFHSINFENCKDEIYNKIKNLKEKNAPVDKSIVIKMLQDGKNIKQISKELNCSYERVYEISKEYGLRDCVHKVDINLVLELWKNGATRSQIVSKTGYGKSYVLRVIKGVLLNENKNLSLSNESIAGQSAKES